MQWWARGDSFITSVGGEGFRADRAGQAGAQRQAAVVIYMMYSPTAPRGCRIPRAPWPMVDCPQSPPVPQVAEAVMPSSLLGFILRLSVTGCGARQTRRDVSHLVLLPTAGPLTAHTTRLLNE